MAKVNWFDILSAPQYEQGGRFNVLALPELIYDMTPSGRERLQRRKDTTEATERSGRNVAQARELGSQAFLTGAQNTPSAGAPELFQPGASLAQTRSQTEGIDAQTAAQRLNTQVGGFNFDEARRAAGRREAARGALPPGTGPLAGVPGELTPEVAALLDIPTQFIRGGETYAQQKEMADLGMIETRGLQREGYPITQPGQEARRTEIAGRAQAANLASEEARTKQLVAGDIIKQAQLTGSPEALRGAAQMLQRLGYPVMDFGGGGNPAASVDAEMQRRLAQPPAAPGAAPAPPSSTAVPPPPNRSPLMSFPSGQQAPGQTSITPGMFGQVAPASIPGFDQLPSDLQSEVRRTVAENPSYTLDRVREIINFLLRERVR